MEADLFSGLSSSPPVNPAEDAKAKAVSAVDELVRSALAYNTPERLRELMDFASRLSKFAPYNTLLLHVQKPGLKYAATVKEWAELGRSIKPGTRPLVVLRFMGPVAFVFDVADTVGDILPLGVQQEIEDPFAAEGTVDPQVWAKMLKCCDKLRIEVIECALPGELAGDAARSKSKPYDYVIRLNAGHELAVRFATLAHELAHLFCGHLGKLKTDFWEDRQQVGLTTRELEAEAVAYLVASRCRLTIASKKYLSLYLAEGTVLPPFGLEHILTAANTVEELTHGKQPAREKARRKRERDSQRRLNALKKAPTPEAAAAFPI